MASAFVARHRGVLWMVAATATLTAMASLVKIARQDLGYAPLELMLWRSLFSVPVALAVVRGRWRITGLRWMASRCLFGFGAMFSWFTAARGLPVGELAVLVRLQPVLIGLLAPLLLGRSELGGLTLWGAVALGLSGSLLLLAPDLQGAAGSEHTTHALWGISAAVCSAVAHTSLRGLGATDDPRAVVFWFQNVVLVACAVLLWATGSGLRWPVGTEWAVLVAIGLLAVAGQLMMTRAYQVETAARVSAATYVGPLLGFCADLVVFSLVPGWHALGGAALVIGAGFVLLSERRH